MLRRASIVVELDGLFAKSMDLFGAQPQDSCLIALSGGSDSVALTVLAAQWSSSPSQNIHALRITHHLRSDQEEDFECEACAQLCQNLQIPFTSLSVEKGAIQNRAQSEGRGIEQAAREERHSLLKSFANEQQFRWILFGHTADDRYETLMMRVNAGSGPEGLRGIPAKRELYLRPLLRISRFDLRSMLEKQGIPWVEDPSNASDVYRRNKVRQFLPQIRQIFPGWDASCDTLEERSKEVAQVLDVVQEQVLPHHIDIQSGRQVYSWIREDWNRAPDYIKARALWNAYDALVGDVDARLSWKAVKAIRRALDQGRPWQIGPLHFDKNSKGNITCQRSSYLGLERGGQLLLSRDDVSAEKEGIMGCWHYHVAPSPFPGGRSYFVSEKSSTIVIRWSQKGDDKPQIQAYGMTESIGFLPKNDSGCFIVYIQIEEEQHAGQWEERF